MPGQLADAGNFVSSYKFFIWIFGVEKAFHTNENITRYVIKKSVKTFWKNTQSILPKLLLLPNNLMCKKHRSLFNIIVYWFPNNCAFSLTFSLYLMQKYLECLAQIEMYVPMSIIMYQFVLFLVISDFTNVIITLSLK